MPLATTLVALLACVAGVLGHPSSEEDKKTYLETRSRVIAHTRRSLERCADSPEARALEERAVARRMAKAEELRAKYGLNKGEPFPFFLSSTWLCQRDKSGRSRPQRAAGVI